MAVDIGEINIGFLDTLLGQLSGAAMVIFYLVLVGGILFVSYLFLSYKYKVLIFELRGDKMVRIKKDRAKFYTDKGTEKYKLFWAKKNFMFPGHRRMYVAGKKDFFILFKGDDSNYHPVSFTNPSGSLEVVPYPNLLWIGNKIEETEKMYAKESFWNKYGTIISYAGMLILIFVLGLILITKLDALELTKNIYVTIPGAGGATPPA